MREAKAHFEGAPEAAPRAEPSPASSSSSSSGTTSMTSSASQPQKAESGRLHLTSRDSSSSNGSAVQGAPATDRSPSNTSQAGGDAGILADAKRNPQTALAAAHKATKQPGSSTALVLQFKEGSNTLKASNLVSLHGWEKHIKPKNLVCFCGWKSISKYVTSGLACLHCLDVYHMQHVHDCREHFGRRFTVQQASKSTVIWRHDLMDQRRPDSCIGHAARMLD